MMAKTVSAISLPEVQQQVDGDADQNAKARAVEIMSNLPPPPPPPTPIADTDAELGIERNDAWFDRVQELQKEYTPSVSSRRRNCKPATRATLPVYPPSLPVRPSSCNCPT